MRIVVLDGYTLNPGDLSWEALENLGDVTVHDRTPDEQIEERMAGAEIVLTNKTPITRRTLDRNRSVRYVGVLATGFNVVDVAAATDLGVVVTNVPEYSTAAVAQFVFALLLETCHHVWAHSERVRSGAWTRSVDFCFWDYPLVELSGRTLGIVGFGRIGQATARIAAAFGMNVIANTPRPDPSREHDALRYGTFDQVLRDSDVITLHCPLTERTSGMVNADSIGAMKDGVVIINTSRGALVVEADLAAGLQSGKVAAAAVDVAVTEPISADSPLLTAPNCIITPHIAWAPLESRKRLMDTAVQNIRSYIDGSPRNVVSG